MLYELPGAAINPPPIVPTLSKRRELSQREVSILTLIACGLCAEEVGFVNLVSPGQVRNILTEIYAALGVTNRIGAVVIALKRGILQLESLTVPVAD